MTENIPLLVSLEGQTAKTRQFVACSSIFDHGRVRHFDDLAQPSTGSFTLARRCQNAQLKGRLGASLIVVRLLQDLARRKAPVIKAKQRRRPRLRDWNLRHRCRFAETTERRQA